MRPRCVTFDLTVAILRRPIDLDARRKAEPIHRINSAPWRSIFAHADESRRQAINGKNFSVPGCSLCQGGEKGRPDSAWRCWGRFCECGQAVANMRHPTHPACRRFTREGRPSAARRAGARLHPRGRRAWSRQCLRREVRREGVREPGQASRDRCRRGRRSRRMAA